jgi:AcrR family transcriptional regulator
VSRPAAVSAVNPRWQRRPDERPRALMASAFRLIIRRGYRRIRVEDVADDAGVSKATVYHYFANKDELLTRTVAGRIADKHAEIERRLESAGGTASDRLRLFLQQFWTMSLTPQAGLWQRLLVSEIVTEAPGVFAVWARGLVQRWWVVEGLIREGQQTGEFRSDADAEVAARLIVSALSHQALFHVHFRMRRFAPCGVDRLFAAAVEQFLHGLRPDVRRATRR